MPKALRIILLSLFGLIGLLVVVIGFIALSDVLVNRFQAGERTPAQEYEAAELQPAPPPERALKVMSYNIKFGGARIDFFFDCYGDRVVMSQAEVLHNLKQLAAKIKAINPDVLFLQEVDIDSKRAAYVDQLQFLLDHTALNYGTYASQWDVAYVPRNGLGKVNSGNAILARWPLRNSLRIGLRQISEQSVLTRFFYLRRNLLRAELELGGRTLALLNTHLTAYAKDDTRRQQLETLKAEMDQLAGKSDVLIAGGDLNTLPPGTEKTSNFPDSACKGKDADFVMDDYTRELSWLEPFYEAYNDVIPLATYQADEARYYTHTTNGNGYWNRRLDYLFSTGRWQKGAVHQGDAKGPPSMKISDHAPISGELILP